MIDTVLAAGVLCWRKINDEPQILLVHRPLQQDVSFPKGKLDPGESLPEAAVREVLEETGISLRLGPPVAIAEYELPGGRPKRVYYWSSFLSEELLADFNFTPNSEVSKVSWVNFDEAKKLLSYRRDIEIMEILRQSILDGIADTFVVIALRHAKAKLPESWPDNDESRPLRSRGREEVVACSRKIYPYRPDRIISSPAVRCLETVGELAKCLKLSPEVGPTLSQNHSSWFDVHITDTIVDVLDKELSTVICSHGPVIPTILSEMVKLTNSTLTREIFRSSILNTAEFVVIHISHGENPQIVGLERYAPRSIISLVPFANPFTKS
ncbi:MAG: NUDIX hydrolase [Microbacteriaceae bacterium]